MFILQEAFNQFQEDVEAVYEREKPVSLLEIGSLYMAYVSFDDETLCWCRVRALGLVDKNVSFF